jgi:hypothetical protein
MINYSINIVLKSFNKYLARINIVLTNDNLLNSMYPTENGFFFYK